MSILRFKVRDEDTYAFEVLIEVDDAIFTEDVAREHNEFFSNAEYRLEEAGTHTKAVVLMLARSLWVRQARDASHPNWIRAEFDEEGLPRLDGSQGVFLVSVDDVEIPDMEILEC